MRAGVGDAMDLFTRLSVALAIGLLVGLERGWRTRDEESGQRAAGFRTFAITGLLGGVTGALSLTAGGLIIGLAFLGFSLAFTAFHWLEAQAERHFSVTTVIAGMLTFMLGTLAVAGDLGAAIAGAVALTALLALREQLHRWVASLTWLEIRAVLTLLAMSFLLLPVLPNRTIDPWNAINPYEIWLLAILIAGTSFAGYVAVRALGERLGVVLAALAGGLASSTATTLALARLGRGHPESTGLISAGVLIAGVVMVVRVGVVAVALNNGLLPFLLLPLSSVAALLAVGAGVLLLGTRQDEYPRLVIANPLALGTALRLAALIVAVLLAGELLRRLLGDGGLLLVAAAAGIADVDAVTITLSRLSVAELDLGTASLGILMAAFVNTMVKTGLAFWAGGPGIGGRVGVVSALALGAGLLALTLAPPS
jgi:uncharacterized membrane protein (DUF4010 family)